MGGLGNQLFQYAAARQLAILNHTIVKLDTTFFDRKINGLTHRNYALNHFNIQAIVAKKFETMRSSIEADNKLQSILIKTNYFFHLKTHIFSDFSPIFNKDFYQQPSNTYLFGYWQSEKYFVNIRNLLLEELSVKTPIPTRTAEVVKLMKSTHSVSLHIRRGDFISNPNAAKHHGGICELPYYIKSICEITKLIANPYFFIFSDDQGWAKKNIKTNHPQMFIDWNSSAHEDLRLMSRCKHNIIANSSFSWWGAWLNNNPDKIVISPSQWYVHEQRVMDLIPETWIKI
jgi:hypothetical protein